MSLVGADLAEAEVPGMETVRADARDLPFPDDHFDQVLLVSTLEHIGADNQLYGVAGELDEGGRRAALRERPARASARRRLLVTVPLGEPGDHGWFRQDDVRGWTRLFARARLFVEEQEAYELGGEGWAAAPSVRPARRSLRCPRPRRLGGPVRRPEPAAAASAAPARTACGVPRAGAAGLRFAGCGEARDDRAVAGFRPAPRARAAGATAPIFPLVTRNTATAS